MTLRFAQSDKEAAARYAQWKDSDPYPSIPPALLNSAEIADYVVATGMVYPFNSGEAKLKPASYEVDLLGKFKYWDKDGKVQDIPIQRGDTVTLERNSIAFAQVEATFRLPNYIAVRFNLRIKHVHRGILLGTGPLVDPGFEGKLLIPLHNLTDNDYELVGGEGLIWMEFTKLNWPPLDKTRSQSGAQDAPPRTGVFIQFPDDKKYRSREYYLIQANRNEPIASSIPVETRKASKTAEKAIATADEAKAKATRFTFTTLISALIAAAGVVAAVATLTYNAMSFVLTVKRDVETRLEKLEKMSVKSSEAPGEKPHATPNGEMPATTDGTPARPETLDGHQDSTDTHSGEAPLGDVKK